MTRPENLSGAISGVDSAEIKELGPGVLGLGKGYRAGAGEVKKAPAWAGDFLRNWCGLRGLWWEVSVLPGGWGPRRAGRHDTAPVVSTQGKK